MPYPRPKIIELCGNDVGDNEAALVKVAEVPIDRPLFEPLLSEIVLQGYEAFKVYEVVVRFRNNDKFTRRLKLEPITHPNFKISGGIKSTSSTTPPSTSLQSGKIAPGMEVQFLLTFNPEEKVDYSYNIVCVTEREKFILPVRAIGARGLLDFPDEIPFTTCPVKFLTTKTLFIRNIGDKAAKFSIEFIEGPMVDGEKRESGGQTVDEGESSGAFEAEPKAGFLDVDRCMQVDVLFRPEIVGSYINTMLVHYDTGETMRIALTGNAENANIRLEKSNIKIDGTYISLSCSKGVRIFNRSDIMAKYQWKTFATLAEDARHRQERKLVLNAEEEQEIASFKDMLMKESKNIEPCDLAPLTQKYNNLRREVDQDQLLFNDPVFSVQPMEGVIWPGSHVDVNVVFSPKQAGMSTASIFCDVEGRQSRLPLILKGDGIGPKARFSSENFNVDEVFINTEHQFELLLENRGEIDFGYSLIKPSTMFGPKFSFSPERGRLKVGQQQLIRIHFASDILGSFHEEFFWTMEGAPEKLSVIFKGHVVGPTFHFDVPELNFGQLSYDFQTSRTVTLINTSHIPMEYSLSIPGSESRAMIPAVTAVLATSVDTEFVVTPSAGIIEPLGSMQVTVQFTPRKIRIYDEYLSVSILGVGEDLKRLPISAESLVPEIVIASPVLNYGDCFLAHSYLNSIELVNNTDFAARYEVLSQDENAKGVYSYHSREDSGTIAPYSRAIIPLELKIKRLGLVNFPIFVKIHGNEEQPIGIDISATGIGPNVIFSATELNWGKIQVLKDATSTLTLTNDSPIPANFNCATVSEPSSFTVEPSAGVIAPGGVVNIVVTAFLDDTLKFTDILKVSVASDGIFEVQLVARGQGTTITFDEGLKNVDFHDVFSNRECSKEFVLVNRGQRVQTLHWMIDEERFGRKDASSALNQVFEVIPTRFTLKPNAKQVIVLKGYSSKASRCKETLICQSTIEKDPARKIIIESTVSANFINPLLDILPSSLKFISAHTRDEDFELISQILSLKNTSTLPLNLSFRCPIPYTVEPNEIDHRLNQGESVSVTINYDPKYNTNRVSCKEHAKLWITYSEHPQRDFVDLYSEITFPNLVFSANSINFGCIPNETEQRRTLVVTNSSSLSVEYAWSFLEGSTKTSGESADVPLCQVFDILPLRSTLQPGESETVEVSFFGHPFGSFSAIAMCDVLGGPKYELNLKGEASTIEYSFDKTFLDFSLHSYQEIVEQEINLNNTGLVSFDFNTIIFPSSSLARKIMVTPSSGTISPHGKQKISVRFSPCVPEAVDECFYIQIALFEPTEIRVRGTGSFPCIEMTIPRATDAQFESSLAEVKANLLKSGTAVSDVDVEMEAERLVLRNKTSVFLAELSENSKAKLLTMPKSKSAGSSILIYKAQQKQTKDKKANSSISESSQVVLANYVCNFGNIIRNTSRKKSFKLFNKSHQPISFQLDKSILLGTGFSIDPDRVKSLPGRPHNEHVEFHVSFHARNQNAGVVQTELPIYIQGGPLTTLTLRAEVTLPDLVFSTHDVDFGEVVCGLRKTISILIHNKNTVPCEWTSVSQESQEKNSKSIGKKKASLLSIKEFDIVPCSGMLQPGEKSVVAIRFSPNDEKEYETVVPIKIAMNNQPIPIHLIGKGFKSVISFEPENVVLSPILPCSEGTEARFNIVNPTNYPLEVYSVDFDHVYLEEEETLRLYDGFEGNCLFFPPREPGHGLPESILESISQKLKLKASISHASNDGVPLITRTTGSDTGVGELIEAGSKSTRGTSPFEIPNESWLTILLHGPPFAGRTTQALNITKTFGHAYIRLDEIIEASLTYESLPASAATADSGSGKKDFSAKDSVVIISKASAEIDEGTSKFQDRMSTTSNHGIMLDRASTFKRQASVYFEESHEDTAEPPKAVLSEDNIIEIIKARLQREDCTHGIVLDGLETKYLPSPLVAMKVLIKAFGERRKMSFFHLTLDATHIRERELIVQRQTGESELEPMQVKSVSEEEYDMMTDLEREQYDNALVTYRKKFKEIQERRKLERKLFEEEMALRLGERKAEEESQKNVRKKQPGRKAGGPSPDKPVEKNVSSRGESKPVKEKGSTSPKTGRKSGEKGEGKNEIKLGLENDDASSRFAINDVMDVFLSEVTMRKIELYLTTIDGILSLIRDNEKTLANRQIPTSATIEKKGQRGQKNIGTAATATAILEASVLANIIDPDSHGGDESSNIILKEINAGLSSEIVFKSISESIPPPSKPEDSAIVGVILPPPYVEQIINYPAARDAQVTPRFFQLLSPSLVSDNDEEGVNSGETGQSNLKEATGTSATTTSSKKGKPVVKIIEDTKDPEDDIDKDGSSRYRWIIPPKDSKELAIKFNSNEIGKFEQTLTFEIVGSRNKFSLLCVGQCRYSQMISDTKKIFPKWRKSKEDRYISHGEYIANPGIFEFGPLLYSKPREKFMEKFPENKAVLLITNPTQQDMRINMSLKNDLKSEVFFFDQSSLDLQPGQSQNFTLWAYPRSAVYHEDLLVMCVKDNPEPYLYRISCVGVKPELEIDKRQLSFDKLLLGRSERRELKLKNNSMLPVAWRIAQIDALGDEFTVSPQEGVIEPYQDQIISAEFRGSKPVVISRRTIRLEVFDTEKIGGVVQEIPISVTAEAYDIAMDLHFPKGYDGGLDFSVIKVTEEGKQMCTLKNKGKYEVGYRFLFDNAELTESFTVIPHQGIMPPSDRPCAVQVIFKANREVTIKDNSSMKCQFYEPTTGEITATIPIKLLARAVFSRFSILPVRDLNFGALNFGIKGTRQFVVENMGEFDFRYSIYKIIRGINEARNGGPKLRTNSRAKAGGRNSPPPATQKVPNKKELVKQTDATNFGAFTVFPTTGIIPPGAKHQVTVEFHPDNPGSFEETVAIDISDRPPNDYMDIIEYRLIGESCVPNINTTEFSSIFEEQTVCKRLELFNTPGNIYAEEDRVFYFGAYLAGQQAQVRFKISNPCKISCDVSLSTRPRSKTKSDAADFAFDLEPKKMTIPSHEYRYVTVFFHPTSIQSYAGLFDAVVENVDQSRSKTLSFELRGEGTLPRVVVEKPTLRSKTGLPLLKFKRLLVGTSQSLPIVLKNEGIIPAKVKLDWSMKEFDEFECNGINTYHTLRPQESCNIDVKCKANSVSIFEGEMKIRVIDNSFEDTIIQLSGEGYLDEITFDNLPNEAESELALGDCFIGETKQVNFSANNHSNDMIRIAWSADMADFVISPSITHIRPRSQKEFTISFLPKNPGEFNNVKIVSKLSKIKYLNQNVDMEWDNKAKSVRWIMNDSKSASAPRKVVEQFPEPPFEVIPSALTDHNLSLSAFADYSSYECDATNIKFKSTLMYQTRVFRFNLRNSGKVILKYEFVFVDEDGDRVEPSSDECPFSVSPSAGEIIPGDNSVITARFSPLEDGVYNFDAYCIIQNLPKDTKPLIIKVTGASMRPFCHFELEESDYITSERRNPDVNNSNGVPSVLPSNTRVIELGSCGVKVRNIKRFYIVNPTSISYEFEWTTDSDQKIFRCLTPKGMVAPNKKFEISFEFIPETIDLKESFWKFSIIGHNISLPFLLVGQALEPNVYMDRVSINFKSLLVGRQVKETVNLVNSESIPFAFSFNETSFELGNDSTPVLRFSPVSGTIGAHSEVPIEIGFTPSAEKVFNFNLICNVKKKPTPVTINVKGEGYEIHELLQTEQMDGTVFNLASGIYVENVVDFGQVQLNEKRLKRVTIVNSGKFNFDFSWRTTSKVGGMLTVLPDIGTVPKGERVVCEVTFLPTANVSLKNIKAFCQIVNGRTYPLTILGSGCRPLLKLSTTSHDFGTQFIYKPGMIASTTKVKMTNNDVRDISFDVITKELSAFEVTRGVSTLLPGESTELEIAFYPKEAGTFSEVIKVEINGLSTTDISLFGSSTEFKVEMLHPDTRNLNFGATRVGNIVTRTIKIINKSIIPATFTLGPPAVIESLNNHSVIIINPGECTLRPKGILSVEMKFQPPNRIPPFSEELTLEAPGISKSLLLVSGACQGTEVKLENDTLPFGAIVHKSFTTRRIQLQNTGDIGAKFHWEVSRFAPDFSISPIEGYISPGMDLPLEITFHPAEINQDIRYEGLACMVEGSSTLYLTLTGMCIPQPVQNDLIKFSTPVRQSDVKSIRLENKTTMPWHICPIIENEYWSGPENIDIEPMQSKSYDIVFTPMETLGAGDGSRHEGSVFFPMPDGSGILYKLIGTAEKPLVAGTITRDVPCKTAYTEVLSVSNWLKRTQRFKVSIELTKPDPSVILKGLDFFDVPPLILREYKLQYYAFKEGVTNAKVIFKNEQTQEFVHYNLNFKSTPPGVISTIEMSTNVRQLLSRDVIISNPLPTPVTFNASCSHPDVSVIHSFVVQPRSDAACTLEYLPLQAKESTSRLTITSAELGVYQYDLKLVSSPAGPERSLHFKVGLGGAQTQTFRFLSYSKTKTEYTCKIDSPDFTVEKSIMAPSTTVGGVEVCIDVTYEPSKLGDIRTQLLVSSPSGGDYMCPLYGHCVAPRPQGPITIRVGSSTSVPFKNVFSTPANFTYVVDNAAFSVKAQETIAGKKAVAMVITAHPSPSNSNEPKGTARVGKLTVTHKGATNVSWIYYLRN